jgi:hypothetical protein
MPRGQRGGSLVLPRPQLGIAEDVGGNPPEVRCGGRGRSPYRLADGRPQGSPGPVC